ncbi:MAG: sulfatase-like hydrolase/transferase [Clostridia bacterium]|nr:sulfatase-like hydrolase/transferase [Clostridia bacterium]
MEKRPNILFILSDQHSPHVLGCAGNRDIRTPNLDSLASEGVVFDNMYCQNPLCVPSRASLITGRYSRNLGIYDNMHIMEAGSTTLPGVLSAGGYRTCLIGKAHFNGGQYHGYQQRPYGDLYGQGHQPDPGRRPEFGINGLGDVLANSGPSEMPIELTQTEICVAEACKWLQIHKSAHPEQPFMLSVHFDKPHFPIKPPAKYFNNYTGRLSLPDVPSGWMEQAVPFIREAVAHNETGHHYGKDFDIQLRAKESYYGCVEWVDDAIGRILETLGYLGFSENTIVIYSSDHGEMCGEHGTWQKTLFFDASARVPFIIRWPGRTAPGTRNYEIAGLLDMFPTLCDAAGIGIPGSCDGISLLPLLEYNEKPAREGIFCESAVLRATHMAGCMYRDGKWKYCYYIDGSQELYDMDGDPDEYENLAGRAGYEGLLKEFREMTVDFWQPGDYPQRLARTPIMPREKHFYPFSNQFVTGDGMIVDARP